MSEEEINYWLEEFEENRRMYMSKNHKILSFYETFKDMKKLKQENTQLKSALKEIRELHHQFVDEESLLCFENNCLIKFMNKLLEIINKGLKNDE